MLTRCLVALWCLISTLATQGGLSPILKPRRNLLGSSISVSTYDQLRLAIESQATIRLSDDIYLTETVNISEVSIVSIEGNGFKTDGLRSVGCFSVQHSSNFFLNNITIINGFKNMNGGGIYIYNSTCTMTNSTISACSAAVSGGAVYLDFASIMTVELCIIRGNSVSSRGGGIHIIYSTLKLIESVVEGNYAIQGGGVSIDERSFFNCTNSIIIANNASSGGAVYATGLTSWNVMDDCNITRNLAVYGGGVFVAAGTVSIANSIVSENTASSGSFTILLDNSNEPTPAPTVSPTVELSNSTSMSWPCQSVGGCITSSNYPNNYNNDESCIFVATQNGVLDVKAFVTEPDRDIFKLNGINYSGVSGPNKNSVVEGDVIYWDSDSDQSFGGFEVCYTMQASGGGFFIESGEVIVSHCEVVNNSATSFGGGFYMEGGKSVLTDVSLARNAAPYGRESYVGEGPSIFITNLKTVSLSSDSFGGDDIESIDCISGCLTGQYGSCDSFNNQDGCSVNCKCISCPAGTSSPVVGSTSLDDCESCEAGKYSDIGASECVSCPSGSYATHSVYNVDDAGLSYPVLKGATTCNSCPDGYAASSSGMIFCEPCPAGRYNALTSGLTYCSSCPLGQYSILGSSNCTKCSAGKYTTRIESTSCDPCPSHTTSDIGASDCLLAEVGYYFDVIYSRAVEICPDGANCLGGKMYPIPRKGYVASVGETTKCRYENNCPAPANNCSSCYRCDIIALSYYGNDDLIPKKCQTLCEFNSCGPGAVKGDYYPCEICKSNYYFSSNSQRCEKCSLTALIVVAIYVCLLILFVMFLILLKMNIIKFSDPNKYLSNSKLWALMQVLWKDGSLMILFSTYQIIQSVTYSMEITYPEPFASFLKVFSFVNLSVPELGCFVRLSSRSARPLLPFILASFTVAIALMMSLFYFRERFIAWIRVSNKEVIDNIRMNFWQRFLFFLYVVTPFVTRVQIEVFDCDQGYYFQYNPSCTTDTTLGYWQDFQDKLSEGTITGICVPLFIFMFWSLPLVWTRMLWNHRTQLFPLGIVDKQLIQQARNIEPSVRPFRFLFDRYRVELPYWEVVDMYRRILFVAIIPAFSSSTKQLCCFGLGFSLLFCLLYREVSPFQHKTSNVVSNVGNLVIFLTYAGSFAIEIRLSASLNDLLFGTILCFIIFAVVGTALIGAYIKANHDHRQLELKRQSVVKHLEWACNFSENKFATTFQVMNDTDIAPSCSAVFFYSSLLGIKQVLHYGIPVKRGASGIPFSLHHPHHLTQSEKQLFGSSEAFVVCSLPYRLLEKLETNDQSSMMLSLPSRILQAMRGSYFDDVIDPRPWETGALILPYHCIKRAYQLSEGEGVPEKASPSFGSFRTILSQCLKSPSQTEHNDSSDSLFELTDIVPKSHNDISVESGTVQLNHHVRAKLKHLKTVEDYLSTMSTIRDLCNQNGLVPLYHYTSPSVAPLILNSGLRMSSQGQGDGGVYFSTLGPCSYSIGSESYEENIVVDCFGKERLNEYLGKHKLDVCLIYAVEPLIVEQALGGRDNAMVVHKNFFEVFALPHSDGSFFLSPDRLMAAFLIDPTSNDSLINENEEIQTEILIESEKDLSVQKLLLNKNSLKSSSLALDDPKEILMPQGTSSDEIRSLELPVAPSNLSLFPSLDTLPTSSSVQNELPLQGEPQDTTL